MKFASLGSGSDGNALLISSSAHESEHQTLIMLDCGFAVKETERRLARLAVAPEQLRGIVVTHEHKDHAGGVFAFARRHKLPVWLSQGTFQAVRDSRRNVNINFCRDGERFVVGDLEIFPYTVPHDAREPLQYRVGNGSCSLGVLTDAGQATSHLIKALSGCDALVLECNYERQMLTDSTYPATLKRRVGGAYGHLSNNEAAAILAALDQSRLKLVVAAHLSRHNNLPELAQNALASVVDVQQTELLIANQEAGFGWRKVMAGPPVNISNHPRQ